MRRNGRREGLPPAEGRSDVDQRFLEGPVACLLGERVDGLQDRDARADERGELAREVHEIGARHSLPGDLELPDALLLAPAETCQTLRVLGRCHCGGASGGPAIAGDRRGVELIAVHVYLARAALEGPGLEGVPRSE